MLDPATSWFEIVELPTVDLEAAVPPTGKGKKVTFSKNRRWQNHTLIRVLLKSVT
jgi:hypothetical protein